MNWIEYSYTGNTDPDVPATEDKEKNKIIFNYPCSDETTCFPFEIWLSKGIYLLEAWELRAEMEDIKTSQQ